METRMPTHGNQIDLAELIAPVDEDVFLDKYLFKKPLIVPGPEDKFHSLFTWRSLNRLLNKSRHDPVRVHMDKVGVAQEDLPFTHIVPNVRGERISRIDVQALYGHLRNGATLVVDAVNEVDEDVATVTEKVGARLSTTRATTVLFTSFGRTPGFAMHWDSRDVYALQVEGEKRWTIYEPSQAFPMGRGDHSIPGSGEPGTLVWDGVLTKGDMLYVPRGWWHEVKSTDSPSVHLALGVAPVTGLDYLDWLREVCEDDDFFRADMPLLISDSEMAAYATRLTAAITERLASYDARDFIQNLQVSSPIQTYVSLPEGVWPDRSGLKPEDRVRLSPLMARITDEPDWIRLQGGGREFRAPKWSLPLVRSLAAGRMASVQQLGELVAGTPEDEIRQLLAQLITKGFLHIIQ
ncbi:hypothetical protein FGD77_02720 [Roseovarius sp. M141]|nr:hypothetical protein [Roseovarius sp. M141]